MFVDTFIRRPILASVCSLVIILAGAIAIPTLPVAQYPELAPPQVSVTAFYTGANAQAVETAVTTPLEQAINGVEGMLYMTSSSTNSGVGQHHDHLRRHARPGPRRRRRAEPRVARRWRGCRPRSARRRHGPEAVDRLRAGGRRLRGEGRYDSLFLSNYIDVYVKDALKRVPGVADVIIFGERKYSMRLWLDPGQLASRGAHRRRRRQRAARAERPGRGRQVGQAPARAGQTFQISVRAVGPPERSRRVREHHRQGGPDGALVRLKDVGTRRARRRDLRVAAALPGHRRRRLRRHRSCRRPTRSTSSAASAPSWSGSRRSSRPG